jgi:hypothetical protein
MIDNSEARDRLRQNPPFTFASTRLPKDNDKEIDSAAEEESCPAFGYLTGLRDRALALQLLFRTGNRDWFSYGLLASWRFNPSLGLLLKFTGDLLTLVLIRGSNLDAMVNRNTVNLLRGLQHHRITFIREMEKDELRKAGKGEPTIDRIEVAEFESNEELREWLQKTAAEFVR